MNRQTDRKIRRLSLYLVLLFLLVPSLAQGADDIVAIVDVLRVFIPVTAYGMTYIKNDTAGRHQFHKAFLSTVGVAYGLKLSIDKKRPNGGDHSFPSGHTSLAFSGASFIQRRYGWKLGVPAYTAASTVGWISVESERHYVEDVLAGAVVGVVATYIFTTSYEKANVEAIAGNGRYGLLIRIRW